MAFICGGQGAAAGRAAGMAGGGGGGCGGGGASAACGGAGGASACGGACGGYDETNVLSYVGQGGDYSAETTYKYAGAGAGQFEMVTVPTNIRYGWCYCLLPTLLIALLLYLFNPSAASTTTTNIVIPSTTAPDIVTSTSEPFCCKSHGLWSLEKKAWCCHHYGVGCPTTAPP